MNCGEKASSGYCSISSCSPALCVVCPQHKQWASDFADGDSWLWWLLFFCGQYPFFTVNLPLRFEWQTAISKSSRTARWTTLSVASFIWHFQIISFRWTLTHPSGPGESYLCEREKRASKYFKHMVMGVALPLGHHTSVDRAFILALGNMLNPFTPSWRWIKVILLCEVEDESAFPTLCNWRWMKSKNVPNYWTNEF